MNLVGFKSDYVKNLEALANFNGGAVVTPPATYYLAMATATPTRSGSFTEVSGASYARTAIANSAVNWTVATSPANGKTTNKLQINLPTPTGAWTTAFGWALMDAPTGGNMWYGGSIAVPGGLTYGTINTPHVVIGALEIQL